MHPLSFLGGLPFLPYNFVKPIPDRRIPVVVYLNKSIWRTFDKPLSSRSSYRLVNSKPIRRSGRSNGCYASSLLIVWTFERFERRMNCSRWLIQSVLSTACRPVAHRGKLELDFITNKKFIFLMNFIKKNYHVRLGTRGGWHLSLVARLAGWFGLMAHSNFDESRMRLTGQRNASRSHRQDRSKCSIYREFIRRKK